MLGERKTKKMKSEKQISILIALLLLSFCSVGVYANVYWYEISPCDAIDISLTDSRVIAFLDMTNMASVDVCNCKNYQGYTTWLVIWHTQTQSQRVYVDIHTGDIIGAGPAPGPCWHPVTTFRGRSYKSTDAFNIKGDMWRMNWEATGREDDSALAVIVYKDLSFWTWIDGFSQDTFPFGTDTYTVYEGAGTYLLDVTPTALEYWSIEVEDFY